MQIGVAVRSSETRSLPRRGFLQHAAGGIGAAAWTTLLQGQSQQAGAASSLRGRPSLARAKRVIFLLQSGAPSQLDLFDPKPRLRREHGQDLPASVRMGQRLTSMTSNQPSRPIVSSMFRFARHGSSGMNLSELVPKTAQICDEICLVRSLHTDAINHDPAITFMQTGRQQAGRPSIGAWLGYGLGAENENLPHFVVMISGGSPGDQPLFGRLWSAGFLPSRHQGVKFRGGREPLLYLSNPAGIDPQMRRRLLDAQTQLNRLQFERYADPAIQSRIEQAELAYRMQTSVPELTDLSAESRSTLALYGEAARTPGTYAANCLLARRLIERGVRFVQLFHRGWDHHLNLPTRIQGKCRETDQASAALVLDLKQRGLLEDTLVVWAGEFGRTAYCQGELTAENYGRDHHPRCFSAWLAGGGIRPGFVYGKTDEFSYNIVENPVHVHDLQATILACLGIDHERLVYRFRGRDYRLTDVAGQVVNDILL